MAFPRPVRLSAAFADLRAFLAGRQRHQWVFAALSVAIPAYFVTGMIFNVREKAYKPPEVIFVMDYAKNRTDAQIRAQQKIDSERLRAEKAEEARILDERRRALAPITKRLDDLGF